MSSVTSTYGANIAFIEELYEKYRSDPNSVSPSWQEFFHDYQPQFEEDLAEAVGAPPPPLPTPEIPPRPVPVPAPEPQNAVPLRGVAGKIAQNMQASLAVPTATSVRTIPVQEIGR